MLSESTKNSIRRMYQNHGGIDGIEVYLIRNQKQVGYADCGLFAIANAFALCAGGQMVR